MCVISPMSSQPKTYLISFSCVRSFHFNNGFKLFETLKFSSIKHLLLSLYTYKYKKIYLYIKINEPNIFFYICCC